MLLKTIKREWRRRRSSIYIPDLGERHMVCDWIREEDGDGPQPFIDMVQYGKLLEVLPDKIVTSLERARLERAGVGPMLKAGLGYVEMLSAIIVDGAAVAGLNAKTLIAPTLLLPANYLQPGGIPGRTLRLVGSGRHTTLTTPAATLIMGCGNATTNVVWTNAWAQSGAMVVDAVAVQTNTQWRMEAGGTVRSVGSAGTVFWTGEASMGCHSAFTAAAAALRYMGSAGSAAPAAATVDMTIANYFSASANWSVTNVGYTLTCHRLQLEALN
jgi:hypothetical protein